MSQIIKRIEAQATGTKYMKEVHYSPLVSTEAKYHQPLENPYISEYSIQVKFGHRVKVQEESKAEAIQAVKKAITELIFGEFRSDLVKLQYLLYNREFDEALKTAKDIEQRMFYDQ